MLLSFHSFIHSFIHSLIHSFILLFQRVISEVTKQIATKLPRMSRSECNWRNLVRNLGAHMRKIWGLKDENSDLILDNFAT